MAACGVADVAACGVADAIAYLRSQALSEDSTAEQLCNRLTAERLDSLCDAVEAVLAAGGKGIEAAKAAIVSEAEAEAKSLAQEAVKAQAEAEAAAGAAKEKAAAAVKVPWSETELALLTKAANKFPGGVPNRWLKMAEFINHLASPSNDRTEEEVRRNGRCKFRAHAGHSPSQPVTARHTVWCRSSSR